MTTPPRPRRAAIIGVDGANYEAIKPLVAEGRLPNLAKLLREGTVFPNALPPYPTLTGSNWATIATGAWPGTHGVTDMSYHVTGEPVNFWHNGFTSDAVEAETLWEALARVGKKSVVLKYTGSWPPRDPTVVMVDGGGGRPFWGGSILELSHSQLFTTESLPNATQIETRPAEGWPSLPESSLSVLEFGFGYRTSTGEIPDFLQFEGEQIVRSEPVQFHGLLYASGSEGYDHIVLGKEKDLGRALAVLKAGEWSDTLEEAFEVGGSSRSGAYRIIFDLVDAAAGKFSLYFTQIYPTDGFTQPSELGRALVERLGAYMNHPGYSGSAMGWYGDETFIELLDYQNQWLANAGRDLMETNDWDLFAMQAHCIDFANHQFILPHEATDADKAEKMKLLARCYESMDRMVGELVDAAGEDALVCVVSDHGATVNTCPEVFVNEILEGAGLLVYEESTAQDVRPEIDRSRTVAEQQRNGFVYISLQGRDPQGVVPPEAYDKAVDDVIDALRAYREPTTGRNPFAMVLRKESARILGLYDSLGRDIGDVVYALLPDFDHEHGRQLPGAVLGGQSINSLLIFSGPGIRPDTELERNAWLVDVAPTIVHALGWPMPTEAEGAVLYQMLEGHTSAFPRQDSMQRQEAHLREAQKRCAVQTATETDAKAADDAEQQQADEPLPQTVEGLKAALHEARDEAEKWKRAYEKYHRITHGN